MQRNCSLKAAKYSLNAKIAELKTKSSKTWLNKQIVAELQLKLHSRRMMAKS